MYLFAVSCISTHSLTKRLTISNALKLIEEGISTHSLTKRLTKGDWSGVHIRFISTHSLTKRLTISSLMVFFIPSGFQLTASRRGWRQYRPSGVLSGLHFNSQPHEEADNGGHTMGAHTSNFNSQPHEEADSCNGVYCPSLSYFNSQPHEEADCYRHYFLLFQNKFQLTASRRGWRLRQLISAWSFGISTHSLTKRLTVLHIFPRSCF